MLDDCCWKVFSNDISASSKFFDKQTNNLHTVPLDLFFFIVSEIHTVWDILHLKNQLVNALWYTNYINNDTISELPKI